LSSLLASEVPPQGFCLDKGAFVSLMRRSNIGYERSAKIYYLLCHTADKAKPLVRPVPLVTQPSFSEPSIDSLVELLEPGK